MPTLPDTAENVNLSEMQLFSPQEISLSGVLAIVNRILRSIIGLRFVIRVIFVVRFPLAFYRANVTLGASVEFLVICGRRR